MGKTTSSSIQMEHPSESWALSERMAFFYNYLTKLTTMSDLSLTKVLDDLRKISTADGIFLFSRGAKSNENGSIKWNKIAVSVVNSEQWNWENIEDNKGEGVIQKLLNYLAEQTFKYETPDVKAEFTPSWSSDQSHCQKHELIALKKIQEKEKESGLDKVQTELNGWGPVCGFTLGHVMIGDWQLGESILVMVRLMNTGKISFFNDMGRCLTIFLLYLSETNSHLFRKRNLERLMFSDKQRNFEDVICAAAYVRSICRIVPLWIEHPEVIIKENYSKTLECLAMIDRKHRGTKKWKIISQEFTPEKAINQLEEVRKILDNLENAKK